MPYVFLSHSHCDKPFARRLAADLRNAGHSVWIDEAMINIGDSLVDKITTGLREVDFVAAIISIGSVDSSWVKKELELASNREIYERRVVILPLLVSEVDMPEFLKGKLYGDFRSPDLYDSSFELMLRTLGPVDQPPPASVDEVSSLRSELEAIRKLVTQQASEVERAREAAYQGKSKKLKDAIELANLNFPAHAPINRTYAFEMGDKVITLDYVLHPSREALVKDWHILIPMLILNNKMDQYRNMMEAFDDMIDRRLELKISNVQIN